MRARALQLVLLLLSAAAFGLADQEDINSLKAEAQKKDHPRLYAEVVRRQVEAASDLYDAGDVDKAQAVLTEIVSFTQKCLESAHDFKNPRKLKDTELTLSKAARRLEEIRRSLSFDDQPPVQNAVETIENARRELLGLMFQRPEKKSGEKAPQQEVRD